MTLASNTGSTIISDLAPNGQVTGPDVDLAIVEFDSPDSANNDLYTTIDPITNGDLTEKLVNGNGVFDVLMTSMSEHLIYQKTLGNITSDQYAKAYVELSMAVMQNAVQFLLQRDQIYWSNKLIQQQTQKAEFEKAQAKIEFEAAKQQAINISLQNAKTKAEIALLTMQIAVEDSKHTLVEEQVEAKRAETLDTRTDGSNVAGVIGKQKDLYAEQILSYDKDAKYKAAKLYSDAWITQKSMNSGLTAPTQFTNANVDSVMAALKYSVAL